MNRHQENFLGQHDGCASCAALLDTHFDRRRFLLLAAGGLTAAALAPWQLLAHEDTYGNYEAMVLSCIDPRFQVPVSQYTASRDLTGKYSQFTIAGAGIGAVAPKFKGWHETFWENLNASVGLHKINRVLVINHRDCGAAKIAYGEEAVATPAAETKTHRAALAEFRKELAHRHPELGVETGLMALDGTFEVLT